MPVSCILTACVLNFKQPVVLLLMVITIMYLPFQACFVFTGAVGEDDENRSDSEYETKPKRLKKGKGKTEL